MTVRRSLHHRIVSVVLAIAVPTYLLFTLLVTGPSTAHAAPTPAAATSGGVSIQVVPNATTLPPGAVRLPGPSKTGIVVKAQRVYPDGSAGPLTAYLCLVLLDDYGYYIDLYTHGAITGYVYNSCGYNVTNIVLYYNPTTSDCGSRQVAGPWSGGTSPSWAQDGGEVTFYTEFHAYCVECRSDGTGRTYPPFHLNVSWWAQGKSNSGRDFDNSGTDNDTWDFLNAVNSAPCP